MRWILIQFVVSLYIRLCREAGGDLQWLQNIKFGAILSQDIHKMIWNLCNFVGLMFGHL